MKNNNALKTICDLVEKVSLRDAEIETLKGKNTCQRIDLEKLMKADEVVNENRKVNYAEYDFESERGIDIMTKGLFVNLTNENEELKAHNSDQSNKIQELKELLNRSLKEKCDIWKWSDAQRDIIDDMKAKNTAHAALVEILKEYIDAGNHVSDVVNRAVEDIDIIVPVLCNNRRKLPYVFKQLQNQVFERMNQHYIHLNCTSLEGLPAALDYLDKEDMFELEILGGVVDKYKIPRELIECSQDEFNKRFIKLQTCK